MALFLSSHYIAYSNKHHKVPLPPLNEIRTNQNKSESVEMAEAAATRNSSRLWDGFTKVNEKAVWCKLCGKQRLCFSHIHIRTKSTRRLQHHRPAWAEESALKIQCRMFSTLLLLLKKADDSTKLDTCGSTIDSQYPVSLSFLIRS